MIYFIISVLLNVYLIFEISKYKYKAQHYQNEVRRIWKIRFKDFLKMYKSLKSEHIPDKMIEEKMEIKDF